MADLIQRNGTQTMPLEDIHKSGSGRQIALNLVGVSDLRYPMVITDRASKRQETIGKISLGVDLAKEDKGAHMSRFVEIVSEYGGEISMAQIPHILRQIRERLESEHARIQIDFPFFLERSAPVSGGKALMDYECSYSAEMDSISSRSVLSVQVPVTSLCPCSKAISDYGAHGVTSK